MMKCAHEQCPNVLTDEHVQCEIRKTCREKSYISLEFVQSCILEQAGTDIMNKVK